MSNYKEIQQKVREHAIASGRSPDDITIVAISKGCPVEWIETAYHEGCRDFGESRTFDGVSKILRLPVDCKWHFIGHLQGNKIAKTLPSFHLIHSIDTLELAEKVSTTSEMQGVQTAILLQVNTSGEKTKQGLKGEEWEIILDKVNELPHIQICGLMTMAPLTKDQNLIRLCFRKLYQWHEKLRYQMRDPKSFCHLSMGMSNDYLIAIEEGATLLRIGRAIFL